MLDDLKSVSFFRTLREPERELLAAEVEHVDLPAGEVLFRQGEPGDAFYVVKAGTLQLVLDLPDGDQQTLATLGAGELVGEMAVLYRWPRGATATTATGAAVLRFNASTIERLFAADPSARERLLEAASRRLPSFYLASVPIFAGLGGDELRHLDLESNWVRLAGGQTLFEQGDPPDYLYVVVRGRLEVVLEGDDGSREVVEQLGAGSVVGEVAILTGEPRTATVRSIRDSELVRLAKEELHSLLEEHPRAATEMMRILAGRVSPALRARRAMPVSTIAVVPAGGAAFESGAIERLVEALAGTGGRALHVNRRRIDEELAGVAASSLSDEVSRLRVATWLREQEDRYRYIVSECEAVRSRWTDLCLREADLVLIVAPAEGDPSPGEVERAVFSAETKSTPRALVLLHPEGTTQPKGTRRWLDARPATRHHHVRADCPEDYARLARFVTGKAVGVALSGGGSRAFAHIGVLRALLENGIPVDGVSGVSLGAFIAAFYAMGHDIDKVLEIARAAIGAYSFARDATLPIVAFLSGKGYRRVLGKMFGELEVEDLLLPFFCVSSNLSNAQIVVHDSGPLWKGIRATTSVPGIKPPLCEDGQLLVDGGVLNNLPVDVMRERGYGTVIASDVSAAVDLVTDSPDFSSVSGWSLLWSKINPFAKTRSLPNLFEVFMRTALLSSVNHSGTVARSADLYLHSPSQGVAILDWEAGSALVDVGYRCALKKIEAWKSGESATE